MIVNSDTRVRDQAEEYISCVKNKSSKWIVFKPSGKDQTYEVVQCSLIGYFFELLKAAWNYTPLFSGDRALELFSNRVVQRLLPTVHLVHKENKYSIECYDVSERDYSRDDAHIPLSKVLNASQILIENENMRRFAVYEEACQLLNNFENNGDNKEIRSFAEDKWARLLQSEPLNAEERELRSLINIEITKKSRSLNERLQIYDERFEIYQEAEELLAQQDEGKLKSFVDRIWNDLLNAPTRDENEINRRKRNNEEIQTRLGLDRNY